MKFKKLTKEEKHIIEEKGTEAPYSGKYEKNKEKGIYICKRCSAPLYKSEDKFDAHCGWPSFDDELPKAVKRTKDADGMRTEITCENCGAHLGHVFTGEHMTKKNVRHCVNSISMDFIPADKVKKETIVLGAGCFWCTEAVFKMVPGVLEILPGYAGGTVENPSYEQVCSGKTGHAEVAKVEFLPKTVSIDHLLDVFFSMHEPTSLNKQGNDVGTQYRSMVLFTSKKQEQAVRKFIKNIQKDYTKPIVTEVRQLDKFYPAEDDHKNYFKKNPHAPYCIFVISPKVKKIKHKFDL
jgi:peptide methionine sulfoxide reductase msrA/msrB